MSTHALADKASHLTASLKQTFSLISKLSSLQPTSALPESASPVTAAATTTPDTVDDLRQDLGAEIAELLKTHEEDLEALALDVDDLSATIVPAGGASSTVSERVTRKRADIDALRATCARLGEDVKLARTRFRHATLRAKRNVDLAMQKEQRDYLASLRASSAAAAADETDQPTSPDATNTTSNEGPSADTQPQSLSAMQTLLFARRKPQSSTNRSTQDDIVLTTQSTITSSLKRTHDLLSSSLERASFARESLESSNAAMQELSERYGGLNDLLSKSKGLLSTLLRSQKSDTWFLQTAVYVLIATLAWLIFRRLLWGPVSLLVIWPLKLAYSVASVLATSLISPIVGGRAGLKASALSGGSSRPPLRVMPSASDRPPAFPEHMRRPGGVYMPAGAGGAGAKDVPDHVQQRRHQPLSDYVGSMVEEVRAAGATSVLGAASSVVAQATQPARQEGEEAVQQDRAGQRDAWERDAAGQQAQRGDGKALPLRDEATQPRNPKKRMMEVTEPEKERQRDEL